MAFQVSGLPLGDGTVEPVLQDHPIGHKNVVGQDRWSQVTGSVILKCKSFCQVCGLSRQVVPHGSGLSRKGSLYCTFCGPACACKCENSFSFRNMFKPVSIARLRAGHLLPQLGSFFRKHFKHSVISGVAKTS